MRPLHTRFARGYQIGVVVGLVIGAGVWFATQSGLDAVQAAEDDARVVTAVALDTQTVGTTLGQIEDAPTSLVLRSDLARHATSLAAGWDTLASATDQPADVRLLLSGSGGLASQVEFFLEDVDVLVETGAKGAEALDERQGARAGRLGHARVRHRSAR